LKRYKPPKKKGPEAVIQEGIIKMLRYKGWHVMKTHGNMFQSGFPDLFACHSTFGHRWIEVKKPDMKGSYFTAAQLEEFPKICANGSGVWVLVGDSEDEYLKLFSRYNWEGYLVR
jgi:Holliday junction resolvase